MATPFSSTTNSTPAQDYGHNQSLPAPGEVTKPVRTLSPGVHALNEPAGHIPTLELAEYSAPGEFSSTQDGHTHQNLGETEDESRLRNLLAATFDLADVEAAGLGSALTGAIPKVSC